MNSSSNSRRRLPRPRVPCEKCTLDGLGKVREGEHGAVHIGDIRGEPGAFCIGQVRTHNFSLWCSVGAKYLTGVTRSLLRRSVLIGLSICAPTAAIAHADGQTALVKLQPGADPASLGIEARPVVAPDVARRLHRDAGRMGRRSPDLGRWVVARVPPGGVAELRARPGVGAATVIQDTPPAPPQDICRTIPAGFGRPPVETVAASSWI